MKRLVTALVFFVATSVSAFAQSFPVPSGWQNQRGSDMKLYSITWVPAYAGTSGQAVAPYPPRSSTISIRSRVRDTPCGQAWSKSATNILKPSELSAASSRAMSAN
jgi:hypothetical protein